MDPFSDFDPFKPAALPPEPLVPQNGGYPDVSNLFSSDSNNNANSSQPSAPQVYMSDGDLFDILGTDNKTKESDDSKMTPTTNNKINAMSVNSTTEESPKKEPGKQKTIVQKFQEIMEPDETEIKALELFNTVESHISALKSHYEELKSCLQTMQDILYPPEESFEAKFKKTHKKSNQDGNGVHQKFKSLFGRNNEPQAEQQQHKPKGAGSTIKEKQHETLDKAYTDFLKTHDLLGKCVDASNDAKEELQNYLNLCQKSKQISILYQNDDGEMSLSRAEQRKEWFSEFKRRMTSTEAGPLNIMYNNFISETQGRIDAYKKEKGTIERRRELRKEGKLKPPTPTTPQRNKLSAGIKILKEKVKERRPSAKSQDLNSDLFDILTPEISNNSNGSNSILDIPITPTSNTDVDESNNNNDANDDEQDQKRLEQLEQEYKDNPIYDRIHNFLDEFMCHVEENSAWKGASDELLQGARDAFEKMIIMKFSNETILRIRNELKEDDISLYNRTWDLSFITPKELDFASDYIKPEMMEMAVQELRRMDYQPSPCEQMDCIVEASRIVGTMIALNDKDANGADDFLPAFIFTLLHAKLGHAKSTIEFIEKIRGPSALRANDGYCFTTFCSALAFIEQVDASLLRMDDNEFNIKIQESREKYCDHYNDVSLRDK